jgi:hypothetical protein
MTKLRVAATTTVLLFCTPALGQTVLGQGSTSCEKWTQARQGALRSDGPSKVDELMYLSWITGYISAYNNYVLSSGSIIGEIDISGLATLIDKACMGRPQITIDTATVALIGVLDARGKGTK